MSSEFLKTLNRLKKTKNFGKKTCDARIKPAIQTNFNTPPHTGSSIFDWFKPQNERTVLVPFH